MLSIALIACMGGTEKNTEETGNLSTEFEELPDLGWSEAYEIPERPFDLSTDQNGFIFVSAQSGDRVYSNSEGDIKALNQSFEEITALEWHENALYYLSSEFGVTGALMKYEDGEHSTLATQSDDGTLFRWPIDLVAAGEGWVIADPDAGGLFFVKDNGESIWAEEGNYEALAFSNGVLVMGGPDGIWTKDWPNGTTEKRDDRAAAGLISMDGRIYGVNHEIGLFEMGGAYRPIDGPARPSGIIATGDRLYLTDRAGRYVWSAPQEIP